MSGRFGLVVRFTVKAGHEEAFDELVAATLRGIKDREPGTLVYACHRVQDAPRQRIFYELYQDRLAFEEHEQQPHIRRFLSERAQHLEEVEVDFLALTVAKGGPAS